MIISRLTGRVSRQDMDSGRMNNPMEPAYGTRQVVFQTKQVWNCVEWTMAVLRIQLSLRKQADMLSGPNFSTTVQGFRSWLFDGKMQRSNGFVGSWYLRKHSIHQEDEWCEAIAEGMAPQEAGYLILLLGVSGQQITAIIADRTILKSIIWNPQTGICNDRNCIWLQAGDKTTSAFSCRF